MLSVACIIPQGFQAQCKKHIGIDKISLCFTVG